MGIHMKKFKYIIDTYKKRQIFFINEETKKILQDVINKNYIVLKEYKNDRRTYVAKIKIEEKYYILKEPRQKKLLRKLIGIFKKCESLIIFENVNKLRERNIKELVNILGGGLKRKKLLIEEEFYVMDYIEGKFYFEDEKYLEIMETIKKIHLEYRYHGDCNPYNFLFNKDKIYVLDTKLKKMYFGNYRAHYDVLTLMKYFKKKIEYPYRKNMFYYIALFFRKQRD